MSVAAPPADPEASKNRPERGAAIAVAAGHGLLAFGVVTALGVVIGMAEYAATKGAYRPWTWIKVGFLYLLSFCGVGVHVDGSGPSTFGVGESHLLFRFPMMVCTALVLWLLFRAGRSSGERTSGAPLGVASAGIVAAAAGFAIPVSLVSLPATLRFPNVAGTVSPVRWQAAVLPFGLAVCAATAGAVQGRRVATAEGPRRRTRWIAVIDGGWRMFLLALGLAFVAFLVLAAVKPDGSAAYARFVRDSGRVGAVTVAHHVLLLPDQSVWVLAPAMGGSTQVVVSGAQPFPSTITMSGIDEGALGLFLDPTGELSGGGRIALGGGFYLFLLVPLVATVLGGRRVAAASRDAGERLLLGVGSGVVFGGLMAVAALFSASALPLPLLGQHAVLPMSIRVTMPSTAWLALGWGVAGGGLGALSGGWPRRSLGGDLAQEPATPEPD